MSGSLKDPFTLCESSSDEEESSNNKNSGVRSSENVGSTFQYANSSDAVRSSAAARMPVSELKRILTERGIEHSDCVEKRGLIDRLENSCGSGNAAGSEKVNFTYEDDRKRAPMESIPGTYGQKRRASSIQLPAAVSKRQRSTSSSNVLDSHIKLNRTDLNLSTAQASSPIVRDNCLTMRQMLGFDASPYYTNCNIDWMVLSNFMVDFDYLLDLIPELFSIPTGVVFYGQAGPSTALANWKQATDVDVIELDPSDTPLSARNPLKYKFHYGVHHTKAFLLGLSNGVLRVIVHTANIMPGDCQTKTQGAYIQDFPLKTADSEQTEFENDMVNYFQTYGYKKQRRWDKNGSARTLWDQLRRYDFSSAKAVLIASTPGYHPVSPGDAEPLRGYLKLSKAIQVHCPVDSASSDPIVCQFSSMGSLNKKWLAKFATALNASQTPCSEHNLESSVKLVFPTADEICNSVEGYAGGGSVPSFAKNVDKDFLQPLYHKWSSSSPRLLHKPRNVPHIKSFYQLGHDSLSMQWFCITSHNLSTAAWGQVQKSRRGGECCFIRHWELGVFVAPSMFGANTAIRPIPEGQSLKSTPTEKIIGIPLPYPIQPTRYGRDDEVFSWEKFYQRRDAFGRRSTRDIM